MKKSPKIVTMNCSSGSLIVKMTLAEIESRTNVNAEVEVAGARWSVEASKKHGNLGVYVKSNTLKTDMNMRIVIDMPDQFIPFKREFNHIYKSNTVKGRGFGDVMPWERIIVDESGHLTIRVNVSTVTPSLPPIPMSVENIAYPDLVLECKHVEFPCNMCIVAVKSEGLADYSNIWANKISSLQFIRTALENKDTWKKKDTLSIEHECATPEILHLVLTAIYDGWQPSMDEQATQIFLLADFLLADSIVAMAVESLKTQLNADTFWRICTVSALVPHRDELLDACATFASKPSTATIVLFDLLNRTDGKAIARDKSNDTIRLLNIAVAKLQAQ